MFKIIMYYVIPAIGCVFWSNLLFSAEDGSNEKLEAIMGLYFWALVLILGDK